jgi:translation initiation factor IF-1
MGEGDPAEIVCFEHERKAAHDYVVRFECRLFQILKTNKIRLRPQDKVVVRIRVDGSLSILWKEKALLVDEIQISPKGRSDSPAA